MAQPVHSSRAHGAPPLKSSLAGDPELRDLVAFFLDDLSGRVARLSQALNSGDTGSLQQIAHQLKGAGGGYGYPDITAAAGAIEEHVRNGEADAAALQSKVNELIQLCQRAIAGR